MLCCLSESPECTHETQYFSNTWPSVFPSVMSQVQRSLSISLERSDVQPTLLTIIDIDDVATSFLCQEVNSEVHHGVATLLPGFDYKLTLGKSETQADTSQVWKTNWHLASLKDKLILGKSETQADTWRVWKTNWHLESLKYTLTLHKSETQTDTWKVWNTNWHLESLIYTLTIHKSET